MDGLELFNPPHNKDLHDETDRISEPDNSCRPDDDARIGKRRVDPSNEWRTRETDRLRDHRKFNRHAVRAAWNTSVAWRGKALSKTIIRSPELWTEPFNDGLQSILRNCADVDVVQPPQYR